MSVLAMLSNRRISERAALAVIIGVLLFPPPSAAQRQEPRIDVEHYLITAEIDPQNQEIKAQAEVHFRPVGEEIRSAAFELHNGFDLSEVVTGNGQAIETSRDMDTFSVRLSLPEPIASGEAASVTFSYDGRLTGREESPVWGINFAAIHSDYAYLMYPARWFPVSGYTADRYTAEMRITVPEGYRVAGWRIGDIGYNYTR